jgi:hypothetical protein
VGDTPGVAVMVGSHSLAELKGRPGVRLARRRTAGCRRVSRSAWWLVPGVRNFAVVHRLALCPEVGHMDQKAGQD